MPSTVEKLNPTRVKLTIEMPFAELQPSIDKAYAEIAQQVKLPGFRKGHVPNALIDQRFGRGAVLQEAINEALPNAYGAAVGEHSLNPLGQPEIEVTKLEDGDLVEFTAEVDVRPEFDLPDLSTLTATVPVAEVSQDLIDEQIKTLRERFATNTDVERPAADGDVVTLDLEGSQDGVVLEDATASGITYKIGSGGMLDGLDGAVTGLSAGESTTFTSQLLGGAHRGEDTEIKVTVTLVQEQSLPEVDDDFAQMVSQFDTVQEMLDDLRRSVENYGRVQQASAARDKVLEDLVAKVEFELPQALIDSEIDARKQQITDQLSRAGLTVEQYIADSDDESAETPEEFWAEIEKGSLEALRAQIVLDKLADDSGFDVTQEELTQLLFQKAQQNGTSPEQEAQHMVDHNHMGEWMQEVRRGKALSAIVAAATITDEDGATVDLTRINADGSLTGDDSEVVEADITEVETVEEITVSEVEED